MAASEPYNSALAVSAWPGRDALSETRFAETGRGMVFAHDVCEPLADELFARIEAQADCVYSEIPWPAGGAAFYRRAGCDVRPHGDMVLAVKARIVDPLRKPSFIIASKRDARFLAADAVQPCALNGRPAYLAIVNAEPPPPCPTTRELLAWLGRRYRSVYDFSCGFGGSLKHFAYAIGSDIDQKCLNYVEWEILNGGSNPRARAGRDPQDQALSAQCPEE